MLRILRRPTRHFISILSSSRNNVDIGTHIFSQRCLSKWTLARPNVPSDSVDGLHDPPVKVSRYSRRPPNALEVLQNLEGNVPVTKTEALYAIRSCKNSVNLEARDCIEVVQKLWKALKEHGVTLEITHYHALLRVYIASEYKFDPEEILEEMMKNNIEPNTVILQCCMMGHAFTGNIEKTLNILSKLHENNAPINSDTHLALIRVYAENNDMEKVEEILNLAVKDLKITDQPPVVCAVGIEYLKRKNLERALDLFNPEMSPFVRFNLDENLLILYHLALQNYQNEFDKFLEDMVKPAELNIKAPHYINLLAKIGKTDYSLQLLKNMTVSRSTSGMKVPVGKFYIRTLIDYDIDANIIGKQCRELMKHGLLDNALTFAMGLCLRNDKNNLALELYKIAHKYGILLREHYFFPLLAERGRKGDSEGILLLLMKMEKEFEVKPTAETIRDYVIPYLLKDDTNVDELISHLRLFGVPKGTSAHAIAFTYILQNKLDQAASIFEKYSFTCPLFLFRSILVKSFVATKNYDAFFKILSGIYVAAAYKIENSGTENEDIDACVIIGNLIYNVIKKLSSDDNNLPIIEQFMQKFLESKLPISKDFSDKIRTMLLPKVSIEILDTLNQVQKNRLSAYQVLDTEKKIIEVTSLDENTLEKLCEEMEKKGEDIVEIKKNLFVLYGRQKNLDKLLKIKNDLERDGHLSKGMYAYLVDTLVENDNWKDAFKLCKEHYEKHENFALDVVKMYRLAFALVKDNLYEEAFYLLEQKVLECNRGNDVVEQANRFYRYILDHFAGKGDVENFEKAIDLLKSHNLIPVDNKMLGRYIKLHLARNDVESAFNYFEDFIAKVHATLWFHEFTYYLLSKDDIENVKRLIDLSCRIHDELNVVCDVVTVCLELGKVDLARNLLQNPAQKYRSKKKERLHAAYVKFQKDDNISALRSLIEVTQGTTLFDRYDLYSKALICCDRLEDIESTKILWTQMQEEDISSMLLLHQVGRIFKRHGIPFNFDIPENDNEDRRPFNKPTVSVKTLNEFIYTGKLQEALKIADLCVHPNHYSVLVKACLQDGKYTQARVLTEKLFRHTGLLINFDVIKFLLSQSAKYGDVHFIEFLENLLPEEKKKSVSLYNALAMGYFNAKRTDEYLERLEKFFEEADDFNKFLQCLPTGSLLTIMLDDFKYFCRINNVFEKCIQKKDHSVTPNILWNYFMMKRDYDEADRIWNSYLRDNVDGITFKRLCTEITEKADVTLGEKLVQYLQTKKDVKDGAIGIGYGVLISAYVKCNRVEEALEVLQRALNIVSMEKIIISSLFTLQASCVAKKIPFPYKLPSKESSTNMMHMSNKTMEELAEVYRVF